MDKNKVYMKLFVVLDDAFGIATGASNYLCKDSVKFIIYIRGVLKETIPLLLFIIRTRIKSAPVVIIATSIYHNWHYIAQ
mgnify:CR=1 FL=1